MRELKLQKAFDSFWQKVENDVATPLRSFEEVILTNSRVTALDIRVCGVILAVRANSKDSDINCMAHKDTDTILKNGESIFIRAKREGDKCEIFVSYKEKKPNGSPALTLNIPNGIENITIQSDDKVIFDACPEKTEKIEIAANEVETRDICARNVKVSAATSSFVVTDRTWANFVVEGGCVQIVCGALCSFESYADGEVEFVELNYMGNPMTKFQLKRITGRPKFSLMS